MDMIHEGYRYSGPSSWQDSHVASIGTEEEGKRRKWTIAMKVVKAVIERILVWKSHWENEQLMHS